jgi:hypothetical protein
MARTLLINSILHPMAGPLLDAGATQRVPLLPRLKLCSGNPMLGDSRARNLPRRNLMLHAN